MSAAAAALGLTVSFGSNLELGIGAAAMAHTIAVVPPSEPELPADLIGPLYFEAALVTDPGFVRWSGANLPAGPGLGVELDREQLDRYAVQY
jgi:muconate cycloisomerase